MLKFHPYSILTGDTLVEFVIYCVLKALFIFITEKAESLHTIPPTGSFLIQESAGWFFVTTHGLTRFFSAGWWGKPAPNARKTEFGAKKVA